MLKYTATSLEDTRAILKAHFSGSKYCFRGQSNQSWGLIPTVFRGVDAFPDWQDQMDYIHGSERDCHRQFRDECAADKLGFHDTLDWLAYEQHHGAPTRLLDWTHQISVAAFFAVSGSPTADAAIFVFDLSSFPFHPDLGRQSPMGGFDLDRIRHYCGGVEPFFTQQVSRQIDPITGKYLNEEKPIPESTFVMWRPSRSHDRLKSQHGLVGFYLSFGAFDFEVDLLPYFTKLEMSSGIDFLGRIIIPQSSKESLLTDLIREGCDEYSIYGGADNLGKRVARDHADRLSYLNPNRA